MKVYEAVYKEGETEGVYGISLVANPAMEDFWIALSEQKQELQFAAVDDKRNLLLGAVLIPEKKIYRNVDGNEFYITFTKDTIGNLAHSFIRNGFQNNSSKEHDIKLSDVSFVESWQVEDSAKDKSALYGKNYEVGTWVTMAKVSDEIYKQATDGTFAGFSIDAILGLEESNLKTEINMNKEDFTSLKDSLINEVKALFNTHKEEVEETKEEVVAEVAPENLEVVEEPAFDAEAAFNALKETLGVEFKKELDAKLAEKDAEITALETKLSKQPETESVSITPLVNETRGYKFGSNRPKSIQDRVFAALNNDQ